MGVPWGIQAGKTAYRPVAFHLDAWTKFCAADLCRQFAIPIDDEIYRFTRKDDGAVEVTHEPRSELVAEIGKLRCDDGTYEEFDGLFDGYALFLPDERGYRKVPAGVLPWGYESAHSLSLLRGLSGSRLAGQLMLASVLAQEHELIVGISY
jgi:hypothetical protein